MSEPLLLKSQAPRTMTKVTFHSLPCAFVWEEIALQCWETQLPGIPGLSPGTDFHVASQKTIVWSTVTSEAQSLASYLWMQCIQKTGSGWGNPIRARFSFHFVRASYEKTSVNIAITSSKVEDKMHGMLLRVKRRDFQRSFSQTSRILGAFVTELGYQGVLFCFILFF